MKELSFNDIPEVLGILVRKIEQLEESLANSLPKENVDPWMNVDELCNYLPERPAKHTVRNWTYLNLIPYYKKGKSVYFRKSEIDKWLENGGSTY